MKPISPFFCFILSSLLFFSFYFVAADLHNVKHNGVKSPPHRQPGTVRKKCRKDRNLYVCNVPIPGPRRRVPIPTPPPVNELIPAAVNNPGVNDPKAPRQFPCPPGSSYTGCFAIGKGCPCPCD